MTDRTQLERTRRRGATLPFFAVLMVVMLAMVAFSVDVGYLAVTRSELQNAADSAALAGTLELLEQSRPMLTGDYDSAKASGAARYEACKFCAKNYGGGVRLHLDRNTQNDPEGDCVVGHIANPRDHNCPMTYSTTPYNSLKVRARRDDIRNRPVELFFARVIGGSSQGLEATATASFDASVGGFKIRTSGPRTSKLLPFALDIRIWRDVCNGIGLDDFQYDKENRVVNRRPDRIKETKLYPMANSSGDPTVPAGNFGTIDIGGLNNSSTDIERQIRYGPNEEDFNKMGGEFSLGPGGFRLIQGDTGVSSGFTDALISIVGQERIICLYEPPVVLSGNNAQYKIVGFAGCVIVDVVMHGPLSKRNLRIQPEFVVDDTAIAGESSNNYYVFKGVTLTR